MEYTQEKQRKDLILASGSAARKMMLKNVGLEFSAISADIDEDRVLKDPHISPKQKAQKLAGLKAVEISKQEKYFDTLVIGSDQVLELGGQIFSKAKTAQEAKEKIEIFNGKTHTLISAVSVALRGKVLWQVWDHANLTMHDMSDEYIDEYIKSAGAALTTCVGAYAFEEHGSWLFKKIDGNYFTILGMPLLLLLSYLKDEQGFRP